MKQFFQYERLGTYQYKDYMQNSRKVYIHNVKLQLNVQIRCWCRLLEFSHESCTTNVVVTYRLQQCLSVFFINYSVLSADNKVVFYFIGIGSVSLQFFVACIKDIQEKELVPKWQFVCAQIVWSHQIRFSILHTNNAVFHVYRNVLQEPLFQWCALHGLGYMEMKGGPLQLLLPRKSEQRSYPSLCWSFWKINWRELWMRMDFCYMGRHLMLAKGGLLSILL